MPHSIPIRWALLAAVASTLAACGGGNNAVDTSVPRIEDLTIAEQDAAQASDEKRALEELLATGLPARIAFRKPEFAMLEFFRGRQLFERETFDGNGRTCLTCHSRATGTVSPQEAQHRFALNPGDALFVADGSDDGQGNGVKRILENATILIRMPLPDNVTLANDPSARSVVLPRGIPSTLNTPALDDTLMLDGREPNLVSQARGAILDHAQARREPGLDELKQIAAFQHTPGFFSSFQLLRFAYTGVEPKLPPGRTQAEIRGRRFFIDAAPQGDGKTGLCAACHSGPMLNETNEFVPVPPFKRGGRFQSVGVAEFNDAGNPVNDYVFRNPDGTTTTISSADPGRALITGDANDIFQSRNAFKIPSLWGVARTAPYFHDNSSKTLEDVARHYARFFAAISPIVLTEEDQGDMVAYMKLLR
jgi:cytochrome c peroxidase